MVIQAIVDIDVDVDFGLAKALKICSQCGLKNAVGNSIKKTIHIVITDNIVEKIACLSSIKGFFTVDLRLFLEICSYNYAILKKLGVNPIPKIFYEQSKILGYIYVDNKVSLFEKTSKQGVVIVRVLKTKSLPIFIEPSQYLIQASNSDIYEKTVEILNILKKLQSILTPLISSVCSEIVKSETR